MSPFHARRRPTAVLAIYLTEAIVAWILASPWAQATSGIVGAHPLGDRALWWEPGMHLLGDAEARFGTIARALVGSTMIGLAAYAIVAVYLSGVLLAALAGEAGRLPRALGRGAEVFWRLFALAAIEVVFSALVLGIIGIGPAYSLHGQFAADPPRAALVASLPVVLALAVIAFVHCAFDLARAKVVADDASVLEALGRARAPRDVLDLLALALPRWLAAVGLVAMGAAFSTVSMAVAAIFFVHQLIAVVRVGLRASVLARALAIVSVA